MDQLLFKNKYTRLAAVRGENKETYNELLAMAAAPNFAALKTYNRMAAPTNATGCVQASLQRELQDVRQKLSRNGITTIHGAARFIDPHKLEVETTAGPVMLASDHALIACGTRAAFDPANLKVPSVRAKGDRAAEIIHSGQAVINLGAAIACFRDTVFN